jgi:flavodoxin
MVTGLFYHTSYPISENMAGIAVYVDSRGGNTRKVADAIAEEPGIRVGDLTTPLSADAKLLFLGSGTYGSAPGIEMMKFVTDNAFTGCRVALFGTSMSEAGAQKMIAAMEDALTRKGAKVLGSYQCRGRFLLFNRGRPGTEDLENAKKFAREMIRKG